MRDLDCLIWLIWIWYIGYTILTAQLYISKQNRVIRSQVFVFNYRYCPLMNDWFTTDLLNATLDLNNCADLRQGIYKTTQSVWWTRDHERMIPPFWGILHDTNVQWWLEIDVFWPFLAKIISRGPLFIYRMVVNCWQLVI